MRPGERSLSPGGPPGISSGPPATQSGNGRWAADDDQVFELGDLGTPVLCGQYVRVQTIWGHERGQVLRLGQEAGFPMAEVLMDGGDLIFIDVARCTPEED